MSLNIRFYDTAMSMCQLPHGAKAPADILNYPFTGFWRTHEETTLICPTKLVPAEVKSEDGFIPFELVGPFAFNLTGILTKVANPLAEAGVSIVALSSFNTDWVLIKADQRKKAEQALLKAGHKIVPAP